MNQTPDTITMRDGFDARLLLSYGELTRSLPRSIQVLDVGCSTGEDLVQQAKLQPDVHFLGVDGCESAITQARARAKEEGLTNVSFEVADLFELGSIKTPEGGFDLAYAGTPPAGEDLADFLGRVQGRLAPHGLVSLSLPARRAHMDKVAAAIEGAAPRNHPLRERLEAARDVIDRMTQEEPTCADWRRAALVDDATFVERYMGGATRSMEVAEVFAAIERAGMTFVRWHDATAWNFEGLDLGREELARVRSLPMQEQFRVVERELDPASLELVVGKAGNAPRERFDLTKAGETHFMVHPEVTFTIDCRNHWGGTQYEGLKIRRGNEEPVAVRPSPAMTALFALRNQREPFSGLSLVETMTDGGASLEDALMALHQLVGLEVLYRPHEFDVAQFYAAILRARTEEEAGSRVAEMDGPVVTPSMRPAVDVVPQPLPRRAEADEAPTMTTEVPAETGIETDS